MNIFHVPVFDHLEKLSDDELNQYIKVWQEEYKKIKKQLDIADEKYNAVMKEYYSRRKLHWG